MPLDLDKTPVRELFQHAFESGNGDMGKTGEIFVAHRAARFLLGMSKSPQPQVDGLFGGSEVGKDLGDHVLHMFLVW